ncbi:MAG: ABC transporter substrate-binding protein, partial [Thermomicrobiales bacterium]
VQASSAITNYTVLNNAAAPFDDPKVREAFVQAFDREVYCELVLSGACMPATAAVPPGLPGYIQSDAQAFDPDAARAALAASSYGGPDGLPEIALTFASDDPARLEYAEWIAGNYRDVLGVELTIDPVDSSALAQRASAPESFPQMLMMGWLADYADPQDFIEGPFGCSSASAMNAGICVPDLETAIAAANAESDPVARTASWERAGEVLAGSHVVIFTDNPTSRWLVRTGVSGVVPTALDLGLPGAHGSLTTMVVEP